jgi:hypothetical protein
MEYLQQCFDLQRYHAILDLPVQEPSQKEPVHVHSEHPFWHYVSRPRGEQCPHYLIRFEKKKLRDRERADDVKTTYHHKLPIQEVSQSTTYR